MTWEELCEKAKEFGCDVCERSISLHSSNTTVNFWKDGDMIIMKRDMKPEQVYIIMEVLK